MCFFSVQARLLRRSEDFAPAGGLRATHETLPSARSDPATVRPSDESSRLQAPCQDRIPYRFYRFVSFITERRVILKILRHLETLTGSGRGPPLTE